MVAVRRRRQRGRRRRLATSQKLALLPTIAGSSTEYNTNAPGFEPSRWYWQAAVTASWIFDLTNVGNRSFDAATTATQAAEEKTRLVANDAIHRYWQSVAAGIAQSPVGAGRPGCGGPHVRRARARYPAGSATQLDLLQAQRNRSRRR